MLVGISCGDEFWGLETFAAVERLGFGALCAGERMVVHRPSWDVVSMCTAIACATTHVLVGATAAVATFRHPTVLAKELTGIDRISGGRLAVAVAAGGDDPDETASVGITAARRHLRADETLDLLKRYFSGETFDYAGRLFSLCGVRMDPPPATPGGPAVWVAGRGRRSRERAALRGDGFLPYLAMPDQCARLFGEVRALAEEAGRKVDDSYAFGAYIHLALDDDADAARRRADEHLAWRYGDRRFVGELRGRYPVAGDACSVAERLLEYADIGCTHAILFPIRREGESPLDILERIAAEVLPSLPPPS